MALRGHPRGGNLPPGAPCQGSAPRDLHLTQQNQPRQPRRPRHCPGPALRSLTWPPRLQPRGVHTCCGWTGSERGWLAGAGAGRQAGSWGGSGTGRMAAPPQTRCCPGPDSICSRSPTAAGAAAPRAPHRGARRAGRTAGMRSLSLHPRVPDQGVGGLGPSEARREAVPRPCQLPRRAHDPWHPGVPARGASLVPAPSSRAPHPCACLRVLFPQGPPSWIRAHSTPA